MRNPHAQREDPLDQRITMLIKEQALSSSKGKTMYSSSRQILVDYFKNSLGSIENPTKIHDMTQEVLHDLARTTNSRIIDGEENLEKIAKNSPLFIIANHYSGYKLLGIEQSEFGMNLEGMDDVVPFPFFYAPFVPVADKLGDSLYDAHLEMPGPFGKIQEEAGLLVVPKDNGAFSTVRSKTEEIFARRSNSIVVIFPEGGTSGKRNMGGPFDLDKFHGGSFAIAEELGIPVLPVAQYFNPDTGFEIGILPPIKFNAPSADNIEERKEYFKNIAESTKQNMQAWLNTRKSS